MKHIPNILTLIRLILVPIFLIIYFSNIENAHLYALITYILAGITDILDGYIARKYNLITAIGTVIDPLADKLMLLAALTALFVDGIVPLWVIGIMYLKEVFMILMGIFFFFKKEKEIIPSNNFGKLASFIFFLAIILVIGFPGASFLKYLIFLAVALKLVAFSSYVRTHFKHKHSTT
ncbi:CDP-diacylglycerol--glycerol-3-phosphate 3-phosphatidyltransferase [Fusibacter tunisiensis]|uniref:CDP-diacylglycerol--glycerol-3-phosphate 3-phosphatidyltransferase n=1 Tax=Fusibacter tunisiensis TaxID=1008308 RepID=A0ABS2MT21_9FIRM|nr:cardiolipin synthase [Fusibacter tunisiensis]